MPRHQLMLAHWGGMAVGNWVRAKQLPPAVWLAVISLNIVAGGLFAGLYVWRVSTFDRTTATILSVRIEERRSRGGPIYVALGELSFTRIDKQGRSFDCRHEFEIGEEADGFVAGDKLEIIPATGTCQRVDVLGRAAADKS